MRVAADALVASAASNVGRHCYPHAFVQIANLPPDGHDDATEFVAEHARSAIWNGRMTMLCDTHIGATNQRSSRVKQHVAQTDLGTPGPLNLDLPFPGEDGSVHLLLCIYFKQELFSFRSWPTQSLLPEPA
jgi:hypothetical protein